MKQVQVTIMQSIVMNGDGFFVENGSLFIGIDGALHIAFAPGQWLNAQVIEVPDPPSSILHEPDVAAMVKMEEIKEAEFDFSRDVSKPEPVLVERPTWDDDNYSGGKL